MIVEILSSAALFALGAIVGAYLGRAALSIDTATSLGAAPVKPSVVVNVPADYRPLPSLSTDAKVISGEKAVLWYSVYCKTMETDYEDSNDAIRAANEAVSKVFPR